MAQQAAKEKVLADESRAVEHVALQDDATAALENDTVRRVTRKRRVTPAEAAPEGFEQEGLLKLDKGRTRRART